MIGNLRRALRHLLERNLLLGTIFGDDVQGRGAVASGHRIEMVERPIETIELGPHEFAVGSFVVVAVSQQQVACFDEGRA